MSKLYLPHSDQFDTMNEHLATIAKALKADVDISTWASVQKAVRAGIAPELIPVGTQLSVEHSVYGNMLFDVVAHNHHKSAYNTSTMTLMCHSNLAGIQFDSPEAFYYADNGLVAGDYNFTIPKTYSSWVAGTYQFTLTQSLPQGGQLCISGRADEAITSKKVVSYASRTDTVAIESVVITSGNGGVNLGTFGEELNHTERISYGSNNYKESALRQFLNSSAKAGSVWFPQTKFDRPPSWATSLDGFIDGLDKDFLDVVGEVVVPCSTNNTYESLDSTTIKGGKYTVIDKFYIPSQTEILGTTTEIVADDSVRFPYYKNTTSADYIKYRADSPLTWWVRSACSWSATSIRIINSSGVPHSSDAISNGGCVPTCTIV